jgi:hypothetical protein
MDVYAPLLRMRIFLSGRIAGLVVGIGGNVTGGNVTGCDVTIGGNVLMGGNVTGIPKAW